MKVTDLDPRIYARNLLKASGEALDEGDEEKALALYERYRALVRIYPFARPSHNNR